MGQRKNLKKLICHNLNLNMVNQNDQNDMRINEQNNGSLQLDINENQQKNSYQFLQYNQKIWSEDDQELLLSLHKRIGNRWTDITYYYPGSSEGFIKNHFYSRLRKSMRKLNNLIMKYFPQKYNKFNLNIIFKLSNISEGKISEKQKIQTQIYDHYRQLLYRLIDIAENTILQENINIQSMPLIEKHKIQYLILGLVALENIFRLIKSKRTAKGKKKNIAYLRQFRFPLYAQNIVDIVITKQNIYLQSSTGKIKNSTSQKENEQNCEMNLFTQTEFQQESLQTSNLSPVNFSKDKIFLSSSAGEVIDNFDQICQNSLRFDTYHDYFSEQMKQFDIYKTQSTIQNTWKNIEGFSDDIGFNF